MPLTLKYEHPDFPEGTEFDVPGLGIIENGKDTELTKEQEMSFVATKYMTVRDSFADDENMSVSGTTTVSGGIEGALGVNPADISDTPSLDPTAENIDELTGKKFEHANLQGVSTDPEVEPAEEAPQEEPQEAVEEEVAVADEPVDN